MQRPGGRSARVRSKVHDAIVGLLDEVPWEEISVPLVAERSGVHQATLYRRWGTTSAILNDAVTEGLATVGALPDTGSLRLDLVTYARLVAADLDKAVVPLVLRAAVLEIRPGESRQPTPAFLERTQQLGQMLDRGRARGEQAPTLDELLELVIAPLYFRALFATPMPPAEADRLVDRLLRQTPSRA